MITVSATLAGQRLDVEVDLEDLWEKVTTKELVEEFRERDDESEVLGYLAEVSDHHCSHDDFEPEDEDPIVAELSDWDRDELRKAIQLDDGRRCIDLLKRARQ